MVHRLEFSELTIDEAIAAQKGLQKGIRSGLLMVCYYISSQGSAWQCRLGGYDKCGRSCDSACGLRYRVEFCGFCPKDCLAGVQQTGPRHGRTLDATITTEPLASQQSPIVWSGGDVSEDRPHDMC
jgi:hypothetical protein